MDETVSNWDMKRDDLPSFSKCFDDRRGPMRRMRELRVRKENRSAALIDQTGGGFLVLETMGKTVRQLERAVESSNR